MKTTEKYGKQADLALSMWVKLVRATETFGRLTGRDIERYGLTVGQFGVLDVLGHLGPMKIGEICTKQLSTGGNMTVVVDNLERDGLVERKQCKEDRRAIFIQLTGKGKKLFDDIFVQHAKYVKELSSVMTEKELIQLSILLKKLGLALRDK